MRGTFFATLAGTAAFAFCVASGAVAAPESATLVMTGEGRVLMDDRSREQRHPASLTKMMTMLLAFEKLRDGSWTKDTPLPVSKHAASMPPTKLGLRPGTSITVGDAIQAMITVSANDAAVAIAEAAAGTERDFARMMNERARALGMEQSHFRNASGLPDPQQWVTPRDMARLVIHICDEFPGHLALFDNTAFEYRGRTFRGHNRFQAGHAGSVSKTGYTAASGFNLVAATVRDGIRYIGVVIGRRKAAQAASDMEDILRRAMPLPAPAPDLADTRPAPGPAG